MFNSRSCSAMCMFAVVSSFCIFNTSLKFSFQVLSCSLSYAIRWACSFYFYFYWHVCDSFVATQFRCDLIVQSNRRVFSPFYFMIPPSCFPIILLKNSCNHVLLWHWNLKWWLLGVFIRIFYTSSIAYNSIMISLSTLFVGE